MLLRTSAVLLVLTLAAYSEEPASSPRIDALRHQVESKNGTAVDQFWQEIEKNHTPLIEPLAGDDASSLVTFIWRGKDDTHNVIVLGGAAGIDVTQNLLTHLGDTDVWYRTYKVRNNARFTYQFSPNDSLEPFQKVAQKDMLKRMMTFRFDPLNPNKFSQGPIPSSYVELSSAPPQPWIAPTDGALKGTVENQKFKSTILDNERTIWVYTPPDFSKTGEKYPLVVAFDGTAYINLVPVPVILDNLIGKKRIPPVVAVIIGNVGDRRGTELPCYAPFADFLAKELVPFMREKYHATSDPARTVVGGSSYGGLASVFAGLRHSEVFGNILSQSGSFWWSPDNDTEAEWLTRQFVSSPKLPLNVFMEVGLMEAGPTPKDGPSQVVTNRHMRDILTAKGYPVKYQEFNGGHEYLNWRGSFADGLLALIGEKANQ